jgi:hypothetical protein
MKQPRFGRRRQLVGQGAGLLRGYVEAKDFDRDQPVPIRLVRPENRTKGTNTNLMQDPERAERRRGGERGRIVSGQEPCSSGDRKNLAQFCPYSLYHGRAVEDQSRAGHPVDPRAPVVRRITEVTLTCFGRL